MKEQPITYFTHPFRSASFESLLKEFIEIPSVSSDPKRKDDMFYCATLALHLLRESGFVPQLIETAGYPIVFGEYIQNPSWKTVLLYNHLDVQPAKREQWTHEPFLFRSENGKYFGRGATDDKGPALTLFFAALWAIEQKLPLNFQIVWELEEEIGSTNFEELFRQNPFSVRPDSVLVSDGLWNSKDQPSSEYGLRGNIGFSLVLETGIKDVHSGVCGGLARNPAAELCEIIAMCVGGRTGNVGIPGFMKYVRRASDGEINNLVNQGFDQEQFKKDNGLFMIRKKFDEDAMRSLTALPTFEVVGFHSGWDGDGIMTIIPHRAEVKISARIVPDQDPDDVKRLISEFVLNINPDIKITFEKTLGPYLVDPTGPYADALRRAVKDALGKECVFGRSGGSIGAVGIMQKHLNVPIVLFGISLPEHGYHAPNEYFEWKQACAGIRVFGKYFDEIASIGTLGM